MAKIYLVINTKNMMEAIERVYSNREAAELDKDDMNAYYRQFGWECKVKEFEVLDKFKKV